MLIRSILDARGMVVNSNNCHLSLLRGNNQRLNRPSNNKNSETEHTYYIFMTIF